MASASSLRSGRQGRGVLASVFLIAGLSLAALAGSRDFVGGTTHRDAVRSSAVVAHAAPSPAPSTSTALVKVTEENQVTTASVIPGLVGLLVGGVWVGGALFAAGAYLSRRKDDVALGLKGVAGGTLEVLNFGAYVNEKYEVSNKIGSAFSDAIAKSKTEDGSSSVASAVDGFSEAVTSFDKEVGVKDTLGSFFSTASDLANQAVEKAVELNEQYKVSDQIAQKITESINSEKKA